LLNIQRQTRAITRRLPGGGKRKFNKLAITNPIPSSINPGNDSSLSPITTLLLSEVPLENEKQSLLSLSSLHDKQYKSRFNSL